MHRSSGNPRQAGVSPGAGLKRASILQAHHRAGGSLPFAPVGAFHGAPFEGYFWRFTQDSEPRVIIALAGITDGRRSLCALAWHPAASAHRIVEGGLGDGSRFAIKVGETLAADEAGLLLDLAEHGRLEVELSSQFRYPTRALGAVGLGSLLPGLGHYWQPVLLGGRADGYLRRGDDVLSIVNARVYAERTWGSGFPTRWWWGQADRFENGDVCVAFAGGPLQLAGLEVAATALVIRVGQRILSFAPPTATTRVRLGDRSWRLATRSPRYRLEVEGDDRDASTTVLPVPAAQGRQAEPRAAQALAGHVRVSLRRGSQRVFEAESAFAGLEQPLAAG